MCAGVGDIRHLCETAVTYRSPARATRHWPRGLSSSVDYNGLVWVRAMHAVHALQLLQERVNCNESEPCGLTVQWGPSFQRPVVTAIANVASRQLEPATWLLSTPTLPQTLHFYGRQDQDPATLCGISR
jgi:hypothetical protein